MTNLYYIENVGCDDTTHGLARLTDDQFAIFENIIENLNKNSTCGCMPTIYVYKIDDSFIRPASINDADDYILYMNDGMYVLDGSIREYSLENGFVYKEGVERVI